MLLGVYSFNLHNLMSLWLQSRETDNNKNKQVKYYVNSVICNGKRRKVGIYGCHNFK